MSGFSISGLVSNINTSALVQQMMQINQMPQQLLMNQQTSAKIALTAYQSINSKFQALQTAAQALSDVGSFNALAATSTDPTVTAATTSTSGAQAGSMTFQVTQTAQAASSVSATRWGATTDAFGLTNPVAIYDSTGTQVASVNVTDPNGGTVTLADAVSALNNFTYTDSNGKAQTLAAAAVQTAPGQYALQVSAANTGSAANFTLGAAGEFSQVATGKDATLTVGSGPGAYTVTSPTNTFTGLMPGVNVTVGQTTPLNQSVTVTVGTDVDGLTKKMQALVDAVNAAYSEIDTDTDTSGAATTSGGSSTVTAPLPNDFSMQSLANTLLQTIGDPIATASGTTGAAIDLGISTDKDGHLTFDADAFKSALQTNPTRVTALVQGTAAQPGLALKLANLATAATNPTTGTITTLITSENSEISNLQSSIDAWNLRLADMQTNLTNQFNAMETALGQLQSEQQWMTAMFASSFGGSSTSSTSSSSSSSGSNMSVSQN